MVQRVISIKLKAFIKPSNRAMCNSNLNGIFIYNGTCDCEGKTGDVCQEPGDQT